MDTPQSSELKTRYPAPLVDALAFLLASSGILQITPTYLTGLSGATEHESTELLEEITKLGELQKHTFLKCPTCDQDLDEAQSRAANCPLCKTSFPDEGLIAIVVYTREAQRTRDIRWVLTLHGMNTQGLWQEDLSWLISRTYGRMIPVALYKYGIIRPGAIIKRRQIALRDNLVERIRRFSGEAKAAGAGNVPDVIAHSFGTWLLGHALTANRDLRVGRVILTGCILRPDFNWASLIENKQVEAVLCHVATKDFWSRIAHYIIPDSGPSGRRGFNDRTNITHKILQNGRHSDFFKEETLANVYTEWESFFTDSNSHPTAINPALPLLNWRQATLLCRATIFRLLLLALLGCFALAGVTALAVGTWVLCHHL